MKVTSTKMIEFYEGQIAKMRRHSHNGLQGSCVMAERFMDRVMTMDSTTKESKILASQLSIGLRDLRQMLKERVDPK